MFIRRVDIKLCRNSAGRYLVRGLKIAPFRGARCFREDIRRNVFPDPFRDASRCSPEFPAARRIIADPRFIEIERIERFEL